MADVDFTPDEQVDFTPDPNDGIEFTPESSTATKARYSFAGGAAEGVQSAGKGLERLEDPGSTPRNFRNYQRTMLRAGADGGSEADAQVALDNERVAQRLAATAPGRAVQDTAAPYAQGAKAIADETPGNELVAKAAHAVGGMVPLLGVAAVPVVGPAAASVTGGLQSAGDTYNQAFDFYRKQGLSEDEAQKKADDIAISTGMSSALVYSLLPGSGKAMAERLMAERLATAKPIVQAAVRTLSQATEGSLVMGSDSLIRNARAMQTFRPDLTWSEALEEAAKSAAEGFVATAGVHGTIEAVGRAREALRPRAEDGIDFTPEAESQPQTAPAADPAPEVQTVGQTEPAPAAPPAEPAPEAKRKGGSWVKWFPRPDGVPDVLDAIHEEGGIASPAQSDFAAKGDWDGYKDAFGQGIATRLRRGEGGAMPDELRDQLNTNHGFGFESTSDMYDAVARAVAERKSIGETQSREAKALEQDRQARQEFENAALKNKGRPEAERVADDPVPASQLEVGDEFTLKGEHFTVTHHDAETGLITVQDGRKFDRQQLHADSEFYPDKGSLRGADPDWNIDFTPETPLPEAAATTKAQMDLLDQGKREAVLITPGEELPEIDPERHEVVETDAGHFIIDKDKLSAKDVHQAVEEDRVGDVLGYGIPRKPSLDKMVGAVTVRSPEGVEIQSVLTDAEHLDSVMEAARKVAGPHDTIAMEDPADMVTRRAMASGAEVKSMAAGAPPKPGPMPPPPSAAPMPPPRTSSRALPLPSVSPIKAWFQRMVRPVQNLFAPQSIDAHARVLANILRENGGKAAIDLARADEAMREYRRDFDRTPVPRGWKYDPAQPLPRNFEFLDQAETNRAALSPEHQQLVQLFDQLFQGRIAEVRRLAPGAMDALITNYFPHIWKDPKSAAAREFTASFLSKSPLHGDKSFLRQRSIPYILDGLKRGLELAHDNPVDLLLIKLHQMDKFILAERTLQEAKAIGLRKYLPVGQRVPDGWAIVNDNSSTKHGPPVVPVAEAFDAGIRRGLLDIMAKLGFPHERTAKLPINTWGQYTPGVGTIKTKFGGPDFVIAHELGHGLDERYGLAKYLTATTDMQRELTRLADLRSKGRKTTASFKAYTQQIDEKMATVLQAYIHAPELMQQVAPKVKAAFENFINAHPELKDLNDIKPGLAIASSKSDVPLPGFTVMGHYIMPEGAAQVLNNHLSPGLSRYLPYRTLKAASNIMNAAQLGLSAFHLGFTSLDATVSSVAVAMRELSTLDPKQMVQSAGRIAAAPAAPVTNYYLGKAVQKAMLEPGSNSFKILGMKYGMTPARTAQVDAIGQMAVTAGLRATVDPFWQTHFTRNLVRAFHEGGTTGYAKTVLNLPMAIVEQSMRPITEFLVPRQKLGVFAQMAMHGMDRLGPGASHTQVREMLAQAADSTENRMGQMTYDNLFYNKAVKDVALLGFRAYGWQLGKYRESLGAVADTLSQAKGMAEGKRPELTNRMAYAVALPMVVGTIGAVVNYMMSGQAPQEAKDYFFPRTGQTDRDGRPQRLMLPSYLKDLISDWHDAPDLKKMGASFYHKLNPLIGLTVDLLRNRNFYDTEIRHDDDPFWKQQLDNVQYVAKSATPFAVTGMQHLRDNDARPGEYALPFFGIVPAKKALTMTPAEAKAGELMQNTLPAGARTQQQFDHAQLLKKLANDLRNDPIKGQAGLQAAAAAGQLRSTDPQAIVSMLSLKPLQYQVHKLGPDDAMRVWDMANPQERVMLRDMILLKVGTSKILDDDTRAHYLNVLTGTKPAK